MNLRIMTLLLSITFAMLLNGCQLVDGQVVDLATFAPQAAAEAEPAVAESDGSEVAVTTADAVEEPTPEPIEIPLLPMSDLPETSASEVFDGLSPYVAFVETPSGTGSAILLESGYLVSNAHVVWPYNNVRIVFSDGEEYLDVPVAAWDMVADLAIIGPLDALSSPINFVDGSDLRIGSAVYLLGYPGEVEDFPQPTITNGILSRIRIWEQLDLSFFQVDAAVTGGNSGGVMVTQQGEVVGITTFYFSGAGYGLVASAADTTSRLEAILNGESEETLSDRRLLDSESVMSHTAALENRWDTQTYVISETEGTEIEILLEGIGNPDVSVQDVGGRFADFSVDENEDLLEVTINVEQERPYLLVISQESNNENTIQISSTHALIPYDDPDDGLTLTVGESRLGSIDIPDDEDVYKIELKADELIEINVNSIKIDPTIAIPYLSQSREEIVYDDDSGEGIFGEDAKLVYRAPEDDTYQIVIGDSFGGDVGGYFLSISAPPTDTEPTEPQVSNIFVGSVHGRLKIYESDDHDFRIQYPASWMPSYGACGNGVTECFSDGRTISFGISEEELDDLEKDEQNLKGFTDYFIDVIEFSVPSMVVESQEIITTPQGLQGAHLILSLQDRRAVINQFIYVNEEEKFAFSATFAGRAKAVDANDELIQYLIGTFREWDGEPPEDDPVAIFDKAVEISASSAYTDALVLFDQVIEARPDWGEGYSRRGVLHNRMDNAEPAIADIKMAISLQPDDKHLYLNLGATYWDNHLIEEAKRTFDEALELDDEFKSIYNMRALANAILGNYEEGLDDIAAIEAIEEDELSPHYLDTRAYVYLKMESYEEAMADYETALQMDFRSAYVLIGHALANIALGNNEAGQELLAEGLEKAEEIEEPEPQMADLLEMAETVREDAQSE